MKKLPKGHSHVVTIGTTPHGGGQDDVVQAMIDDLQPSEPDRVVVLATADSKENAERLLKGVGVRGRRGRIRLLASAQSLDEAYIAANEEIASLLAAGIPASSIILHYTAGTKVMSAGAVLAAVNNDVQSLRYLYSEGRKRKSVPVTTPTGSVLGDKQIRLAHTLLLEMRFRSAGEVLAGLETPLLTKAQQQLVIVLLELSHAFEDWDRFRFSEFLDRYRQVEKELQSVPDLHPFRLGKTQLTALEKMRASLAEDGVYPDELLIDLLNNAIRRLIEGRPDDALIRLHRAAELYAQAILKSEYGIRTDNVEIRKIPPRNRPAYEAERALQDARIKIGLRKSYELLEILGNPVGRAYREHEAFRAVLDERRNLVLAHGTRPASMTIAIQFFREVEDLFRMRIADLDRRAAEQQFTWIDQAAVLERLGLTLGSPAPQTGAAVPPPAKKKKGGKTKKQ